jgi:hypothetical protein
VARDAELAAALARAEFEGRAAPPPSTGVPGVVMLFPRCCNFYHPTSHHKYLFIFKMKYKLRRIYIYIFICYRRVSPLFVGTPGASSSAQLETGAGGAAVAGPEDDGM